jgi:hypothetical protein
MVVEIHVKYLGVSGGDGHHEFHTDKKHPGHLSASQLNRMEFPIIKACAMADNNYGVPLEISRMFIC